jgi:Asp-tRNA(Asn)/Glu-tRNA(Gln) amidotransferase A subunit family amidase
MNTEEISEENKMTQQEHDPNPNETLVEPLISAAMIGSAEILTGLSFTEAERSLMVDKVNKNRGHYEMLRTVDLPNRLAPALFFNPALPEAPPAVFPGLALDSQPEPNGPALPANLEELAFYPVTDLGRLLANRQVTSTALTEMYLARLKRYDPTLNCVVTLTEALALAQAKRADEEIAAGHYRGALHGIPWGAKDLLATQNYPTTWGARPFKEQVIAADATVVRRLEAAGAVLLAKLSLGALAWGDVWFGGQTKNPWNPEQGASGSSAGSGAATAAGLVSFSLGSETYGSIISPATTCGVSGLRPTFGRVSRAGAMTLSWSMDKIGPMCRSAADCALVFAAIYGPDGQDLSLVDRPFSWAPARDLTGLRIGYVAGDLAEDDPHFPFYQQTLDQLRRLGATLTPFTLPAYPIEPLQLILEVEAAAAFDEFTRTNRDDELVRQVAEAWPNVFRQARLIPAVEYLQANRIRTLLMQALNRQLAEVELYVAPSLQGPNLLLTNLTGHPAVVVPNGFDQQGLPTSVTFTGRLYDEGTLLAVATAYQAVTDFHRQLPPLPV